jgi:alcohol dehydrogenase (cytochrome c)
VSKVRIAALALAFGSWLVAIPLLSAAGSQPPSPTDWRYYNGDIAGKRFAELRQITPQNVSRLGVTCSILLGDDGAFETAPLVIGRTMYLTTEHETAAFDAVSCAKRWVSHYTPEQRYVYPANRGVAILGNRVFRGTGDGRLMALDATSGRVLWKIKAVDPVAGMFLSSAPLAWNGLVFIGTAGSDWGSRGQMMAYDPATGRRVWLFHTVPSPSETGGNTWGNPRSIATGGGAMWSSYTLDPASGELFVPVGNPAPDWDARSRPGTNLFTDSAVVLDAKSGKLRWWYQLVPRDSHDYDLGAAPALYTNARGVPVMVAAGKDGYVHFVDRRTHRLIVKTAISTLLNNTVAPTTAGVMTCPGSLGGTEWFGPSIDVKRGLVFDGTVEFCGTFKRGGVKDEVGVLFAGGSWKPGPAGASGRLTALDATTGAVRWKRKLRGAIVAGVTSTSSGIVFAGDMLGTLHAFASASGAELATWKVPGAIAGGIVSYAVRGQQYVAVPNGNVSRSTFGGAGSPTMTIYALNATHAKVVDVREAPSVIASSGTQIFSTYCLSCHGTGGVGGSGGPSIKGEKTRKNLAQTVQWIENPKAPMPKLYPTPLTSAEVKAVAAYVQSL